MQTIRTPGVALRLAEGEAVVPTTTTVVKEMQILKTGRFFDPRYKWFEVTDKMLAEMIQNFKTGIRGIVPALDYAHDSEGKAAGWIKDLFLKDGERAGQKELWGKVEITPTAQKQLADKEWGYISSDFDDNYQDNETGKKHGAVLKGAALTNRPVIKGMDAVIQLSESSDAVSEKIKKLIAEGKSQDEAVAIALEMERTNKLSETEGDTMDQKEMEKKLADSEKMCADVQGQMDSVLKAAGVTDLEGLMKWIAEQKAKAGSTGEIEMEKELADTKKMLAEANTKLAEADKKAQTAEKEVEFSKLLSEGKAVAAQREAFISGDMAKFIELSQPIKLSEQGHGGGSKGGTDDADAEILKEAKKLSEEKSIPMNKAISQVLASNKELAEKRNKALN